jgi:inner membrane transporter RhtA
MRERDRIPPQLYFVVSAVFHYLGPAFAVLLFARVEVLGVAWLRIASAAAVFAVVRRPWRAPGVPSRDVVVLGVLLAVMNACFYEAIDRLPLGTAVAVEFCGPVAVAALASRRPRDIAAVVLAAAGVALIADVRWAGQPVGVVWAGAAAALWAAYILLGKRVASAGNGLDDMAVGFTVAAVLLSPLAFLGGAAPLAEPQVLVLGLGVGVLSSVVPYVLDQVVLRRVGQARFAVLLALLPATATLVGLVGLGQVPDGVEAVGILAVVGAVALRSRDGDAPPAD